MGTHKPSGVGLPMHWAHRDVSARARQNGIHHPYGHSQQLTTPLGPAVEIPPVGEDMIKIPDSSFLHEGIVIDVYGLDLS